MGSPGCGWLADGSAWQVGWQWYQWSPCTGHYCAPRSGPGHWGQSLPTQQCTGLPPEWSCWCHSLPPDHCCLTKKRGVSVEEIAENGGLSHIWKVRDSPGTLLNTAEQLKAEWTGCRTRASVQKQSHSIIPATEQPQNMTKYHLLQCQIIQY